MVSTPEYYALGPPVAPLLLIVHEPSGDSCSLRELCLHRVDCIYLDLPLSHPATAQGGAGLVDLGFFFGGIIPEVQAGAASGDVLRLQYLNNVEIEPDDVHTASDFGCELLNLIFQQKDSLQQPRPI